MSEKGNRKSSAGELGQVRPRIDVVRDRGKAGRGAQPIDDFSDAARGAAWGNPGLRVW